MGAPGPFYPCYNDDCACETVFRAKSLRMWGDVATCEDCYDRAYDADGVAVSREEDEIYFSDLPPFVPDHEKEIVRLKDEAKYLRINVIIWLIIGGVVVIGTISKGFLTPLWAVVALSGYLISAVGWMVMTSPGAE